VTRGQELADDAATGTAAADGCARTDGFAPAIDSPPLFAAALDPQDGGCFTLEQAVPYQVNRR
jgi:hypothetical protein